MVDLSSLSDVESLLIGFLVCLIGSVVAYLINSVVVSSWLGGVVSLILAIVVYFVVVRSGDGSLKYYVIGYFLTLIVALVLTMLFLGSLLFLIAL